MVWSIGARSRFVLLVCFFGVGLFFVGEGWCVGGEGSGGMGLLGGGVLRRWEGGRREERGDVEGREEEEGRRRREKRENKKSK